MCTGCSMWQPDISKEIVKTLEEKYPQKTFEVVGQEGLFYQVTDADGIEFVVEPLMSSPIRFWCTDNYLDAYFQADGRVERCNEILERYGVENRVEIGEPFELNLGVIDEEENRRQMSACLDELGEVFKIPFEVTYFDKGTPQQGERYRGSSKDGTFSYISLDYTFKEPHIISFLGEGTISIKDMQDYINGSGLLEDIVTQVREYDLIGEALEPEFSGQIKKVREEGKHPPDVLGIYEYSHFSSSVEVICIKIKAKTESVVISVKNEGEDADGNKILRAIAQNGDEILVCVGRNEEFEHSYKIVDVSKVTDG